MASGKVLIFMGDIVFCTETNEVSIWLLEKF